jgi:hypothetical protein
MPQGRSGPSKAATLAGHAPRFAPADLLNQPPLTAAPSCAADPPGIELGWGCEFRGCERGPPKRARADAWAMFPKILCPKFVYQFRTSDLSFVRVLQVSDMNGDPTEPAQGSRSRCRRSKGRSRRRRSRRTVATDLVSRGDAAIGLRAAIKIESGAKSALDPNSEVPIKPYVDDDLPALDLTVPAVCTVDPERIFWDKVVILHGLRRWFDKRGELRGGGQRVSRHYYDLHRLAGDPVGEAAIAETALGADCVAHARMFFNRPDFDLASAAHGSLALAPHDAMIEQLRVDYRAMQGMIFGDPQDFEAVLDSISSLETRLNENGARESGAAQ